MKSRALIWVSSIAVAMMLTLLGFALSGLWFGVAVVGDGRNPDTYGFDLTNLSVPRAALVASGNPRDFLLALNDPKFIRGSEVVAYNARGRSKYLVSTDRVIGVQIKGEYRAYPLRLINAHEIINDTLAGLPIAVTYSPFCDSVVVFDRRGREGVRQFRVSGLLCSSNLVMYAVADDGGGPAGAAAPPPLHLYSQLLMRSITDPVTADNTLTALPGVSLCSWQQWLDAHPDTSVVIPDISSLRRMKAISYERYFDSNHMAWPMVPLSGGINLDQAPIEDAAIEKEPCLATFREGAFTISPAGGRRCEYLAPSGTESVLVVPGFRFALENFLPPSR